MHSTRRNEGRSLGAAALAILAAAMLVTAQTGAAQTGAEGSGAAGIKSALEIKGFLSSAYTWNFNKSAGNSYRVFDTRHDSFTLDEAQLSFAHSATGPGQAGFRADLVTGSAIAPILAGAPDRDVALEQAYLRWIAPVGTGLTLDAGKIITHLGYELAEGVDGWNDHYSHSFSFGWAVPFTHTGLRASYAVSPALTTMLEVTNGWDNNVDRANQGKSAGGQVIIVPTPSLNFCGNFIYGAEGGSSSNHRWVVEGIVGATPVKGLRLGLDALAGGEDGVIPAGGGTEPPAPVDASWSGVAGYINCDLAAKLALHLRGEVFDDPDGVRTGLAQTLTEFTLTPEYRISEATSVRCDLRLDRSDKKAFVKTESDGTTKPVQTQPTIGLNWVYRF